MFIRFVPFRKVVLFCSESILIFAAICAAAAIRLQGDVLNLFLEGDGIGKALLVTSICQASFFLFDLYDFYVVRDRQELEVRLVQALGLAALILAALFYFIPQMLIGRGIFVIGFLLVLALMVCWRIAFHIFAGHPAIGERVLIVGAGAGAIDLAKEILDRRDIGLRVVGFVADDPQLLGKSLINPAVVGLTRDIRQIVKRERVDRVIVAMEERRGRFPTHELLDLRLSGRVVIEEAPSLYERITGKLSVESLRPSWLLFSGASHRMRLASLKRRAYSLICSIIGLILSAPIMLVTALLIKLESPGPVFYRQERVGKNGKIFKLIKFRSMRNDAEAGTGPVWAQENDPRVTRVGRAIRKLRIDELPQFFNVLKGEMNLVGPRPERPFFVEKLEKQIPFYSQRHIIEPGVTGWAQIKYPYGSTIEDALEKLKYDLFYIKNATLALDMLIILETVKTVLLGKGAR